MGQYFDSQAEATNAELSAAKSFAAGLQARNQAYAEAYKLEKDSNSILNIAGENLMRMSQNRDLELSAFRSAQAASGFSLSGSKRSAETSLAHTLDIALDDAIRSTATQDANAREQAAILRHEGNAALKMGLVEQSYGNRVAKANRAAGPTLLLGQTMLTGAKLFANYGGGK